LRRIVTALALVAALPAGRAAGAQPCAVTIDAVASVSAIDPRWRLSWIDQRLSETARTARVWTWGWGGGIAAAGVGSLVPIPFVRADNRIDWYTSAFSAAVGVVPFLFSPLSVTRDAPELRRLTVRLQPGDDACPLLAEAERMLVRNAENQSRGRAWWLHAANLAFNTGITLFLGVGYGHWSAGLINGLSGAAVGEAIIFTQPRQSIEDLAAYRRGDLGPR
jgi:hypothetical protein